MIILSMSVSARQKTFENSKTYSNNSSKTREDSNLMCISCRSSKGDLLEQIAQLKDKAHQSFMQVLQIQQLHDEELSIMREQFQEKEAKYTAEIQHLNTQLQQSNVDLKLLEKNVKRHSYDFGPEQLIIDNIDAILCQQGDNSYLDQSQLLQFKDIISVINGNDYVNVLRKEIYKDIKFVSNHKTQIEKLFIIIKDLREQNSSFLQKNQSLTRSLSLLETQMKTLRHSNQSLNNEVKFMADQVKRLGSDKLRLQKKLNELQRSKGSEQSKKNPTIIEKPQYVRRNSKLSLSPNNHFLHSQLEKSASLVELERHLSSDIEDDRKQINQLNYAKFMINQQIEIENPNFKKRGSNEIIRSLID